MKNMYKWIISIISTIILSLGHNSIAYGSVNDFYLSVAPLSVNFHIVAPDGSITGYSQGSLLRQIPYLGGYVEGGLDYGGPDAPIDNPLLEWHKIEAKDTKQIIPTGKYKLVLYGGNAAEQVKIGFTIAYLNNLGINTAIGEYIMPNVVWTYEFDIPVVPPANGTIMLTKVSTPNDLITDINALAKEDYIGNAKFVAELIKEINEIEAEKAKGKIDDGMTPAQKAKKEYQELLKELNEKWAKPEKDEFVDPLALDILERDITYIINYIQ